MTAIKKFKRMITMKNVFEYQTAQMSIILLLLAKESGILLISS